MLATKGMVLLNGGTFQMGAADQQGPPDEYPRHSVTVPAFWMDTTEVTNAQFAEFVQATGYVTTAEKAPGWEALKHLPPTATASTTWPATCGNGAPTGAGPTTSSS